MMEHTVPAPITSRPLQVRPPYDQHDITGEQGTNETVDQWWDRRCTDGLAVLLAPLEGVDVSDYERHTLDWLTGREDATIAVVAALLHRARAAHPLPTQP